ncbi:MAG: MerR family transcriptional regulator [Bacillaceae bacterium]|nr:MerR family transcriptional regulator [Bacillaceae bacterium]
MNLYKIGELALKADVSTRTIDYYTNLGLIQPVQRSSGNYRLYSEDCLVTLKMIERLKKEKYSLREIKEKLASVKDIPDDDVLHKLEAICNNMEKVEQDLKDLEPILKQIHHNKELKKAVQEMATRGVSMAQVILTLLNETMYML